MRNPDQASASRQKRYRENPEKNKEDNRLNRLKNLDQYRATRNRYERERRAADVAFRLTRNYRARIRIALKNNFKGAGTQELLGMETAEFRIYLQGQFLPGMSWDNYGVVWEIDHIRPCASFDLTNPAQQRECFNWSNCQPLLKEENRRKGAHV